ncbi:sigma factor-like helix-turn-helix DNA-binding protein [Streptomyces goshikiensis]|uniref:sigma factor-like helix-turn-helix DNA-binding protein n=1 Tax=Streptomyces goshikiensis TaxID=1942 RepID=UPI0033E09224
MVPHRMIEQLKHSQIGRIGMLSDEDPVARANRQLEEDAALVGRLREAGFEGQEMDLARERLWSYAVLAVNAWCSGGIIDRKVRESTGFHGDFEVYPHHADILRSHPAERVDLALSAVISAWPGFLDRGLLQAGWNPDWEAGTRAPNRRPRAASLRTYFTRGVLQAFPRAYRAWGKAHDLRLRELGAFDDWTVHLEPWWMASVFEDESVLVNEWLRQMLSSLPTPTRYIFRLIYDGYSYDEIGDRLGITAKMVTDRVYRARTRLLRERERYRQEGAGAWAPDGPGDRLLNAAQDRAARARKAGRR